MVVNTECRDEERLITESQGCVASDSSSFCRICQDNSDTEEHLSTTRCGCKGQLSRVHRSCLLEWVRYKGSNKCEICAHTFTGVLPPASGLDHNQIDAIEAVQADLAQYQPLSRRKRTTVGGVILFLAIVTIVTGVLTVGAEDEFRRTAADPWGTDMELRKAHMMLSICLSFLFFCVTLTIGLIVVWLVLELYFYMNRRRIYARTAARFLQEARRRSTTAQNSGSTAV
ncbi:E3 ubiquitin-protein ligase MARCHF2-like [Mya arenaria]|uniref:E3 ubiquitin-protein ligase MARCHF2-like n=1 Tax=Mya arenaria TaxID=6604 RepID=UPI0022E2BA7D|nr:E3 ubiquitin-protein ligase MARCHF2-like [Mya arenaria]